MITQVLATATSIQKGEIRERFKDLPNLILIVIYSPWIRIFLQQYIKSIYLFAYYFMLLCLCVFVVYV